MGELVFGLVFFVGLVGVFGFFRLVGFTPEYIANNED